MWFVLRVLLRLLRLTGRSRQDLILENLALRHRIAVLERTARRPALRDRDRRRWSLLAQEWIGWRTHLHIVQPATVVGWHRTAWRRRSLVPASCTADLMFCILKRALSV